MRTAEDVKRDPMRYDEFEKRGERWRVRTRSPRMVWLWCETRSSHGKYMHLPAFIKWARTAEVIHIAQPKEKTDGSD